MPKTNKKHAWKDSNGYKGKWRTYKVLDTKIRDAQKTVPMSEYFKIAFAPSVLILIT